MTTITLEPPRQQSRRRKMDQDELQEYYCLRLEGHSETEALRLARAARQDNTAEKILPHKYRNGGTVWRLHDHHLTDDTEIHSLTSITRTEADMAASEAAMSQADEMLCWLTPAQREAIIKFYGVGCEPMSSGDMARETGGTATAASKAATVSKARQRIREIYDAGGFHAWVADTGRNNPRFANRLMAEYVKAKKQMKEIRA